jgi:hypothetical protein
LANNLQSAFLELSSRQSKIKLASIFVSDDHSDDEFRTFFDTMPGWFSFPRNFDGFQRKSAFLKSLDLLKIPHVIVMDAHGNILNDFGVEMMQIEDPAFKHFPWFQHFG